MHHHVGALDFGQRARYAELLDFVGCFAQSCRVDHVQRNTVDVDRLFDSVTRRAGDRRDDRDIRAGQCVHQARFADVRRAHQHDVQPIAQQRALLCLFQQLVQIVANNRKAPSSIGLLQKIELFFREIERRFDQHAQFDQGRSQRVRAARELAGERADRGARRTLGRRIDQVRYSLGLRQVEPVVQKCALREFPGLCDAQSNRPARLQTAREQHAQHDRSAMTLQLEHVLAGIRVRRRKVQRNTVVDLGAVAGNEPGVQRAARHQLTRPRAEDSFHDRRDRCAGNANDSDTAAARPGGNRNDRISRRSVDHRARVYGHPHRRKMLRCPKMIR